MKKRVAQNNILLELHIPDFNIAKDFYSKLGFNVVWERRPENDKGYLVMKREGSVICFFCGNEQVYEQEYFKKFPRDAKRGYATEIVIPIEDIDGFYEKIKDFVKVVGEFQKRPWGAKDFRIEDPFGFYIRFTELHDILDSENAIE
jgi:lactoylglutathione lyase